MSQQEEQGIQQQYRSRAEGKVLKQLRAAQGLSQAQVCDQVDEHEGIIWDRSELSRLENGYKPLTTKLCARLCCVYNIDVQDFEKRVLRQMALERELVRQRKADEPAAAKGREAAGQGEDVPPSAPPSPVPLSGSVPFLPAMFVGREEDTKRLKERLIRSAAAPTQRNLQRVTVVRGWPGIGKTTLAAVLAHDPEVMNAFAEGVLWVSLGTEPDILSLLAMWGRELGHDQIADARTVPEASARLASVLQKRRMLLIIDDAWKQEHARPFLVGGAGCAMLVTTRDRSVARSIAPSSADVYVLPVLAEEDALELLRTLAPNIVERHRASCMQLCKELECLPLALQVAGRLLDKEKSLGADVAAFLEELRTGAKILQQTAPGDRVDLVSETTPTVAALFEKSTDRLDDFAFECFALLGPFAPKPATFDLSILKRAWNLSDPRPVLEVLVERGLLEPAGEGCFQMHALLVTHARSLCAE